MALQIDSLLELNNEELINASMNLVDNASTYDLKNCFENVFKESIMKYLLQTVIQNEIEQLTTYTTGTGINWKRLSLISRIAKLKHTSQTEADSKLQKQTNNNITIRRNINSPSTIELLIDGFLRNEMNMLANTFPIDISSICQQFIGDISNIAIESLLVFSHKEDVVISSIQQNKNHASRCSAKFEYFSNKLSNPNKLKLVSPNKILTKNHQQTFSYFNYIADHANIQISDNVLNVNIMRNDNANSGNRLKNMHGVVQCIDTKKSRFLNFGGIEYHNYMGSMGAMGAPSYSTERKIDAYVYGISTLSNVQTIGKLIYGRGNMSLCNIKNEQIAVIGGQKYNNYSHDQSYPHNTIWKYTISPQSANHVELFDLESNKSVLLKHLNYARVECGSYYNSYLNEIIVFGGHNGYQMTDSMSLKPQGSYESGGNNIANSMEIYDFHKNIWIEVPYLSNIKYDKYPCIWTVGSQCICVAQTKKNNKALGLDIESEWIDLRTVDQYKPNFMMMDTVVIPNISIENVSLLLDFDSYTAFV